ncbi:MAG: GDP-L-fucose synthase, partial [Rhodospirillales bacterium]|nr:GDP-L-fucose synthase [Rhodospirillales bacterium]
SDQVFREFLHVDDCADALVHLIKYYSGAIHVNMGTGEEVTIKELAEIIAKVIGFEGELEFDTSKPDGSPRKLLDSSRMQRLGWTSTTSLEAGLTTTYQWFLKNISD